MMGEMTASRVEYNESVAYILRLNGMEAHKVDGLMRGWAYWINGARTLYTAQEMADKLMSKKPLDG